jgi:hypothetical protein
MLNYRVALRQRIGFSVVEVLKAVIKVKFGAPLAPCKGPRTVPAAGIGGGTASALDYFRHCHEL